MTVSSSTLQPQVDADHYQPDNYDELHRWVSYWYQIQSIVRAQPKSILKTPTSPSPPLVKKNTKNDEWYDAEIT